MMVGRRIEQPCEEVAVTDFHSFDGEYLEDVLPIGETLQFSEGLGIIEEVTECFLA